MSSFLPTYTTKGPASFWRTFSITIDGTDGTALRFGNVDPGSAPIRMAFSIERNFSGPGPRNLVLYNLSPATRNLLKKGTRVVIKAGYNKAMGTICIGSTMKVKTERTGVDITTTMELIDSESFSSMCVINKSFAAATKPGAPGAAGGAYLVDVLSLIADAMQLDYDPKAPIAVQGGVVVNLPNPRYASGLTLNGTCGQALDLLLHPFGLLWNIANGALNIIPRDSYDGQPVRILNRKTGLINTPSYNEREHVLFQTLMDPRLQPNNVVHLSLPQVAIYEQLPTNPVGYYKVLKTIHKGDTHGGPWDVSCEGEVFEGSFNLLGVSSGNKFAKAVVPG